VYDGAEQTRSLRQPAYRLGRVLRYSHVDEVLEGLSIGVQDSHRAVARAGDLACLGSPRHGAAARPAIAKEVQRLAAKVYRQDAELDERCAENKAELARRVRLGFEKNTGQSSTFALRGCSLLKAL
jgi:hypothetical protein